jgi:hypothetical protein
VDVFLFMGGRVDMLRTLVVSTIFFILVACGGQATPPTPSTPQLPTNTVELAENAVILDSGTVMGIIDVQKDKVIFNSRPTFKVGDIIVSGENKIILRKVLSIQSSGSIFIVVTQDSSLGELIKNGKIEFNTKVFAKTQKASALNPNEIAIKLCPEAEKPGIQIQYKCDIELDIQVKAEFNGFDLSKIKFEAYGQYKLLLGFDVLLNWKLEGKLNDTLRYFFSSTNFAPSIKTPFGSEFKLPIEIGPNLYFRWDSDVKAKRKYSYIKSKIFGASVGFSGKLGFSYENGNFNKISDAEPVYDIYGPALEVNKEPGEDANLSLKAGAAVGFAYSLKFFGKDAFDLGFEPRIETDLNFALINQLPGFRIDWTPELKFWAGLRVYDFSILGLVPVKGGDLTLLEVQNIAKRCGSIPPDGSVSISPAIEYSEPNVSKKLTATINGYAKILGSCDRDLAWKSDGGTVIPSNLEANFQAAAPGDYTITATNKADSTKTGTNLFRVGSVVTLPSNTPVTVNEQIILPNPTTGGVGGDVMFLFDRSSSFGDDVTTFRDQANAIFSALKASVSDLRVGLSSFVDAPCSDFGDLSYADFGFNLDLALTKDTTVFSTKLNALDIRSGNDGPESQLEAMVQAMTGTGVIVSGKGSCDGTANIPVSNAGWQAGRLRFLIVSTDASFHRPTDFGYPYPSSVEDVIAKARQNGTTIFFMNSGSTDSDANTIANATKGAVFNLGSDSSGITDAIRTALQASITQADVELVPDGDTQGLVKSINPVSYTGINLNTTRQVSFSVTFASSVVQKPTEQVFQFFLLVKVNRSEINRIPVFVKIPPCSGC